jgi:hypothetical protein
MNSKAKKTDRRDIWTKPLEQVLPSQFLAQQAMLQELMLKWQQNS